MRRTKSSESRPPVPGARIRALPAAARPPAPLRGRRPAQALRACRQGARVSAVTAPGSGRPPRSWSPAASPPTHRGPSCDSARGSRNGGTRALRRSPKTPGSIDTGGTNERCERVQRYQSPPMRSASTTLRPNPCACAMPCPPIHSPMAPRQCPLAPAQSPAKAAPGRARRALLRRRRLGGGSSRACRLSLPGRRSGAFVAKRVVTGARSGLRASGGKGIAKKIAREAFVTGWYGAAIHRAAAGSVVG